MNSRKALSSVGDLLFQFLRFRRTTRPLEVELERRERWSPEAIQDWQIEQLRQILSHCAHHVPYYRALFRRVGFDPDRVKERSDLGVLPPLTKDLIRSHGQDLFADGVSQSDLKKGRTGGSTGEPTPFYLSREEAAWFEALVRRCRDWIGVRPGDRMVKIAGRPYTSDWRRPFIQFVNTRLRNIRSLPAPYLSDSLLDSYIRALEKMRPPVLYGYPSAMELLSRRMLERDRRLPSVRVVWTSSESLLDHQRALIREAFGCEPFDGYGGGDAPLAMECRAHQGLHVFQHARFIEVVDERGLAVPAGGTGRVLVTLFFNRAWPYVRYDTGDLAEVMPEDRPCPCGVRLPRFRRIHGRTGDILVTPDGRRATVANVTLVFGPIHDRVRAYQFFQERPDEIEVRIVPTQTYSKETEEYIERSLRLFLGCDVRLTFRKVDDIVLTPAGKRRILVSTLPVARMAGQSETRPHRDEPA